MGTRVQDLRFGARMLRRGASVSTLASSAFAWRSARALVD